MSEGDYWEESSDLDENNSVNGEYTPEESEEDDDIENESRYIAYEKNAPFSPQFTSPVLRRMKRESPSKRSIQSRYPASALFSPTPPIRIPLNHAFLDSETLQRLTQPKPKSTQPSKTQYSKISSPIQGKAPTRKTETSKKRKSVSSLDFSDELSPILKKSAQPKSFDRLPAHSPAAILPMSPPSALESKSRIYRSVAPSTPTSSQIAPTARETAPIDVAQRIAMLKAGAMKAMNASKASENSANLTSRI